MNKVNKAAFICSKGDLKEPKCKEVAELLRNDIYQHAMAYDDETYFYVNPNITLPDFNKKTEVEKFLITAFKANGIDTPNNWGWSKSGLFEKYGYTFVVFLVQSEG